MLKYNLSLFTKKNQNYYLLSLPYTYDFFIQKLNLNIFSHFFSIYNSIYLSDQDIMEID
jgi:hypothetical protein